MRALEASYLASRQSRDVLVERFLASRGNLFDVVAAEDAYFETAAAFIQTLSELDAARYVLLSRTGDLLDSLGIDPAAVGGQDEQRARHQAGPASRASRPWLMEPMRRNRGALSQGRARGRRDQHLRPDHLAVHDDGLRPGGPEQRHLVAGRAVDRPRHRHHLRFHPEAAARLFRRHRRRRRSTARSARPCSSRLLRAPPRPQEGLDRRRSPG